jgi:hypothetical protein
LKPKKKLNLSNNIVALNRFFHDWDSLSGSKQFTAVVVAAAVIFDDGVLVGSLFFSELILVEKEDDDEYEEDDEVILELVNIIMMKED